MRRAICLSMFALAALTATALAAEKAAFIQGTFSAGDGCEKLKALDKGAKRTAESVPEVLTADGFKGFSGHCDFTKVYEHEAGKSWIGQLFCRDGDTISPLVTAFALGKDGAIIVGGGGEEGPEVFRRCSEGEKK
ncbi:MAG: hypothetical protein AB7E80_13620 [Hyphomicrobiaceae bacterium]